MRALGLILIGGAGWYAWQQGILDPYLPDEWQHAAMTDAAIPATDTAGQGPETLQPTGAPVLLQPVPGLTKEENLLREYDAFVSNYAASVPELAAAIMWQESRGNPRAISSAGARGLMQVMPPTAKHMHDIGYTKLEPTLATLLTKEGSIYFGTAYMEYLASIRGNRSWEWFIRAYNGGPGGATKFLGGKGVGKYARENNGYYTAVWNRWQQLKTTTGTMA